jgi:hypothetical protein
MNDGNAENGKSSICHAVCIFCTSEINNLRKSEYWTFQKSTTGFGSVNNNRTWANGAELFAPPGTIILSLHCGNIYSADTHFHVRA